MRVLPVVRSRVLTASLGANVATAGLLDMNDVPAWLRILVAGWPAVAFLGGTLLAHSAPKMIDHAAEPDTDDEVHDQAEEPELLPEPPVHAASERPPAPATGERTGRV